MDEERGTEKEIRRTREKERWRVRLIYVASVRDNRKVKGNCRGLKGGGERKQREGQNEKVLKERGGGKDE